MIVTITLQDNLTGLVTSFTEDFPVEDPEYYWEEGAGSCDCVRGAAMYGNKSTVECGDSRIELVSIKRSDAK